MKKTLIAFAVLTSVLALGTVAATASPVAHCSGHNDPAFTKVEGQGVFDVDGIVVTVAGPTVTFTDAFGNPVDVDFCVKAALGNSGDQSGSSFTVDWTNNGGQIPDMSYTVVHGIHTPDPCEVDPESCGSS